MQLKTIEPRETVQLKTIEPAEKTQETSKQAGSELLYVFSESEQDLVNARFAAYVQALAFIAELHGMFGVQVSPDNSGFMRSR